MTNTNTDTNTNGAPETIRQMLSDWNAATPAQRQTALDTAAKHALLTERHRLEVALCTDFDMSGWATGYARRIEDINTKLARIGIA